LLLRGASLSACRGGCDDDDPRRAARFRVPLRANSDPKAKSHGGHPAHPIRGRIDRAHLTSLPRIRVSDTAHWQSVRASDRDRDRDTSNCRYLLLTSTFLRHGRLRARAWAGRNEPPLGTLVGNPKFPPSSPHSHGKPNLANRPGPRPPLIIPLACALCVCVCVCVCVRTLSTASALSTSRAGFLFFIRPLRLPV
jgi:hypothetical protein